MSLNAPGSFSDYLEIQEAGLQWEEAEQRVLILTTHDAQTVEAIEAKVGDIRGRVHQDNLPWFDSFLNLDRDAGSGQVADAIFSELATQHEERMAVRRVSVKGHRGVDDMNRYHFFPWEGQFQACRNIWDTMPHEGDPFFEALYGFHCRTRDGIEHYVAGATLLLDIHTMAASNPVAEMRPFLKLQTGQIKAYLDATLNAHLQGGAQRQIDLLTKAINSDTEPWLTDEKLAKAVHTSLSVGGQSVEFNKPYALGKSTMVMSKHLLEGLDGRGMAIDIPKWDLIGEESTARVLQENRLEDPANTIPGLIMEDDIDPEKVAHLAKQISEGVSEYLHVA